MRRFVAVVACLVLAACSKRAAMTRQEEVRSCGAISLDAAGTATCLVQLHGWKQDEANIAARRQQHEADSLKTWLEDSSFRAESSLHRQQVRQCKTGDVSECLQGLGWTKERAVATADSLWNRDAAKHQRQVRDCASRRGMNPASCLMLSYQWISSRALAAADSLTRAKLTRPARR